MLSLNLLPVPGTLEIWVEVEGKRKIGLLFFEDQALNRLCGYQDVAIDSWDEPPFIISYIIITNTQPGTWEFSGRKQMEKIVHNYFELFLGYAEIISPSHTTQQFTINKSICLARCLGVGGEVKWVVCVPAPNHAQPWPPQPWPGYLRHHHLLTRTPLKIYGALDQEGWGSLLSFVNPALIQSGDR